MKLLICDRISPRGLALLKDRDGFSVVYQPGLSGNQLLHEIKDAIALIVRSRTRVSRDVIEAANQLRVIGRAGAGIDNIDLPAATRKGVLVMNTPRANSVSAAEHAFALLMALARRIPRADMSVKAGEWNKTEFLGQELRGKTLGILGLGQIGSLLARHATGFEMRVIACDPFVSQDYASDQNVELEALTSVFENSDFLSLHLPLTDETRGIVCKETLSLMQSSAFLINAARGSLIVESDLLDHLEKGRLAGAALDVFEREPEISQRLRENDRVVLTPHIAGSTVEAQDQVGLTIASQVMNYLEKDAIVNAVNFFSLSTPESAKITAFMELAFKLGSFAAQICDIRVSKVGIRYYGELAGLDYRPISNHILRAVLGPLLAEPVNEVNARTYAGPRGIEVIETVSTRSRGHANLISLQLRNSGETIWVEGSILHQGRIWLVSVDGIPLETPLGNYVLFIRNRDEPGVIGNVGTILGKHHINIASFVLGRADNLNQARGVINTDNPVPAAVMNEIREIPAISYARLVELAP